jgi:hypothetical protein
VARISVYVPDAMKAQMDALGDRNWSEAAQAAFRREIESSIMPGDSIMNQVIERLRVSKASFEERQAKEGRLHGQDWAKLHAAYDQLRNVARLKFHEHAPYARQFDDTLGPSEHPEESFWYDPNLGGVDLPSDAYVEAYHQGALDVWNEVRDKI